MAKKILVIDDKPRITQLLKILLEEGGYEAVTETDPHRALAFTREGSVDLVVCDIQMPAMSGYEFCEALRRDARTARVPLLFLSSKEEWEGRLTGDIVGANGYIQKPFERDILLAKVRELAGEPPGPSRGGPGTKG